MFLEDSTIGRDVWRETFPDLLDKMSQLFPVAFQQEGLRNGTLCYAAIKVNTKYLIFNNVACTVQYLHDLSQIHDSW